MSYKLQKPYTNKKKADFIVKYNHNQGLSIKETGKALYALEAWETIEADEVVNNKDAWDKEQEQKERERLSTLSLTSADVERAIYKAKGMDFEDIVALVQNNSTVDIKALKIELKANNFYRGNPYVEQIGLILGFTSEMLDNFFKTKDYKYLTQVTLMVNVIPETATVTLNGQEAKELTMPYNSTVEVVAKCEGYNEYFDTFTLTENKIVDVELEAKPVETDIDTNIESEVDNARTIE